MPLLDLTFSAEQPVCCPESPVVGNVIRTGFTIPASAVQGAILWRLNEQSSSLASQCLADSAFAAWPLNPCGDPRQGPVADEAVRVSLTHRAAKLVVGDWGVGDFSDDAIAPYDWTSRGDRAPLKASDGVLLRQQDGSIVLWKSSDMPRVASAHGVHGDTGAASERDLYTLESMAPLVWRGILSVPTTVDGQSISQLILDTFAADPIVSFGKRRTLLGAGKLEVVPLSSPKALRNRVKGPSILITQSPIDIGSPQPGIATEEALRTVVDKWAAALGSIDRVWGYSATAFGWNRQPGGPSTREAAIQVVLPGAVIRFSDSINDARMEVALVRGIGPGRDRGFGRAVTHPGVATSLRSPIRSDLPRRTSADSVAIDRIFDLVKRCDLRSLPSSSQLMALATQLKSPESSAKAREYLDRQMTDRGAVVTSAWKEVGPIVHDIIGKLGTESAVRAVKLLADLRAAGGTTHG